MSHDLMLWLSLVNLVGLVLVVVLLLKVRSNLKSSKTIKNPPTLNEIETSLESVSHVSSLSSLGLNYPVFLGGPSIDGHHVKVLLQKLIEVKPRVILELGSGTSTVLISKALEKMGKEDCVHIAVDHIDYFLELTKDYVKLNGLEGRVNFEHCPLGKTDYSHVDWYTRIPEIIKEKIDLVIVDGPPAYEEGKELARYPALPVIYPFLSERCAIILDDANRPGEINVVNKWKKAFPEFQIERVRAGKGVVVMKRGFEY